MDLSVIRRLAGFRHVAAIMGGAACLLSSCQKTESVKEEANPGRELVMASIEAHGGIERWRTNGALKFRWKYHMSDLNRIVDTVQIVDPVTLSAKHTVAETGVQFGYLEGQYWLKPANAKVIPPPQFWTLTPIYFLGIPFVFDDAKANYELFEEAISFEGESYTQVKITYQADAGDSPDDHYVLLIDPETKLTRGAYYTVTNPLVFKGGTPVEKLISLDDLQDVNGLLLAGGHVTYTMNEGVIGDRLRFTEVSEVEFLPKEEVDFSIPEEATILNEKAG